MRYFFHLRGAVDFFDDEGCEFASLAEARCQAVRSAGEYLRDEPKVVRHGDEFRIDVTDPGGHLVFMFTATASDRP